MFCSARSIDHVGDLYPACSVSFVCLVPSWMTVISSCSRSNHRFRKKFQLLFAIGNPLCGSMHVVRPSVVLILVSPRRSSQSNDSSRILTYPLFGCDGINHTCPTIHFTHLSHITLILQIILRIRIGCTNHTFQRIILRKRETVFHCIIV